MARDILFKTVLMLCFVFSIVIAFINCFAKDITNAIWCFLVGVLMAIFYFEMEVEEDE